MKRIFLWVLAIALVIVLPPRIAPFLPALGVYAVVPMQSVPQAAAEAVAPVPAAAAPTSTSKADVIFADIPLLKRACSCESWGDPNKEPREFNADGSILWGYDPVTGKQVKRDVGACQINTIAHATEIASSGLDVIHNLDANVLFAKKLYGERGMEPWDASKACWAK